jgi:hypothetical protein
VLLCEDFGHVGSSEKVKESYREIDEMTNFARSWQCPCASCRELWRYPRRLEIARDAHTRTLVGDDVKWLHGREDMSRQTIGGWEQTTAQLSSILLSDYVERWS